MESPDVVDTSDVEEREDFAFPADVAHRVTAALTAIHSVRADAPTSTPRRDRSSDDEAENSLPRKRSKVVHSPSPGEAHTSDSQLLHRDVPPLPASSQYWLDAGQSSPDRPQSLSVESSAASQPFLCSPSRSLSILTSHNSLFSSPHCRPTPPTSSQCSHDQCSSVRRKLHAIPSSPLTPISSPPLLAQTLSQSPDPLQLRSPHHSQAPHPAPRPSPSLGTPYPVRSPPVVIPEDPQPLGRYSLRRREARQLNPYAYDKLVYKQQLKFHPDAIVKHRSPRRRHDADQVGDDGTQDELVFSIDNPVDDGDYVDVEITKSRRGVRSLDGLEVRPTDEGWLPEALKDLSSSDEDGNEIHKLARKIRKEREKAEAMARAEGRRAAAEARQAVRRAAKRRLKPFPVREDARHSSLDFSERASAPELSPSPLTLSRAHSEPIVGSFPPSSARSSSVHPTPQVSSHSPASSLRPLRSPDFSVYMQQEDSYPVNDIDVPRNMSPVDLSVVYSTPPSPHGPPTSGASALLSNTSGIESESDQPRVAEMSSKDKKRLRALKRMMPATMVAKLFGSVESTQWPLTRAVDESSGSEVEEVRLIPGLAKVRRGKYRDMEVRGDPESSDAEWPTELCDDDKKDNIGHGATEIFSDGQSAVSVRRFRRPPMLKHGDEVISLSSSSAQESSEGSDSRSGDDDDDVDTTHRSLFDRPAKGPSRERSLIDWMLTRTRSSGKRKIKSKQTTGSRISRSAPRLDIITRGARRHGEHHQTRLPFVRTDTGLSTTSSAKHSSENRSRNSQLEQDRVENGKQRKMQGKRQSKTNQESIFNIRHDATRITSRHHEGRSAMVIGDDDSERQGLDPGWRAEVERWNKSPSPAHRPAGSPAPAVRRPRLHRRASPRPGNEIPLPFYFRREEESFTPIPRNMLVDMNIIPLPSGVKFGALSYIGKGFLHELILVTSGNLDIAPPISCSIQGFEIEPTTSATVFGALLGPLFDRFATALHDFQVGVGGTDTIEEWATVARASSRLLSWLVIHAEDQEFVALEVTLREYSEGLLRVLETLETTIFSLSALWFVVELFARLAAGVKYRRRPVTNAFLIQSAKQLIRRLLGVDLQPAFVTFQEADSDVDVTALPHRAAELWVCLIHLLPNFEIFPDTVPGHHPLWLFLAELHAESCLDALRASEDLWRTFFSLCAVSQFSVHGLSTSVFRLPAAWDLVAIALKVATTADPEKDRKLTRSALSKRDYYVSILIPRCFLLWSRWGWRLDDGIAMFKSLQEIFRSRNFANLLHESTVPIGFIEKGDLDLLSKLDARENVFEIFMKMVIQAVQNASTELDPKQRSTHIKKLLQIAVPVSPVPFTRSAPPSPHALSMLVNRFSAMAVAVHLDPMISNVKFRIGQAKRCVSFADADNESRVACVYGMMHFAMIVRHHKVVGGLGEVLGWLREMADTLMDEYMGGDTGSIWKKPTITLIQLLIGSVRRVIETPTLDKGQSSTEYPDPALLDGPWVIRVFSPRTDLITIQQTGVEIRMLVQSFLSARLKALPAQAPPPPVHSVESQESQDEYDRMFLDLKDEELLAALGEEAEVATVADHKSKEDALCKVLDKSIIPAVYRLVCKYFGDKEHVKTDATSMLAADQWIDCWVGCANILVQNSHKDWGLYMKLGHQSWEKIIDDWWRRRVGLRFNLTLLRLDPGAYSKLREEFISVFLVALLSSKATIEHEFISVVLSLDGLQHPLLRGAPVDPVPGERKYKVGAADYEAARERIITTVLANAARCLRARVDAESQGYVERVVTMFSTIRDIYRVAEGKKEYCIFCQRIFGVLLSHPELVSHPRMSGAVVWGRNEWNVQ